MQVKLLLVTFSLNVHAAFIRKLSERMPHFRTVFKNWLWTEFRFSAHCYCWYNMLLLLPVTGCIIAVPPIPRVSHVLPPLWKTFPWNLC